MKTKQVFRRLLSGVLAAAMTVTAVVVPTSANSGTELKLSEVSNEGFLIRPSGDKAEEVESSDYADTDVVRVSIFLDDASTIKAGFDIDSIATDRKAIAYRDSLKDKQEAVEGKIEKATSEELDVVHNLTLAANVISANVKYGQIKKIEKISGVKAVVIENQYEAAKTVEDLPDDPNMSTSTNQIGSNVVWAEGYTGAGTKIAVIDTGIDTTHVSFDEGAYLYSLSLIAEEKGMTLDEYKASLNLLDAEAIEKVADQLNVKIDVNKANVSEKIPFAFNYVDLNYDVTHANDTQGEHGSHVEGIAAANKYIPVYGGNTYASALDAVYVQGVAPDAQIITMKVFGTNGGAYDSDYMLAIEDAIVLGADAINLSLGSGMGGNSKHANAEYQQIFEDLAKCGAVVSISAGNSGHWADSASTAGYLYADDVNAQTDGSPGSYTNAFTVASADNMGTTGEFFTIGGHAVFYTQTSYSNKPLSTLSGKQEYIYLDAVFDEEGTLISGGGTKEEWDAVGDAVKGKIALVSRGVTNFTDKAKFAVEAGAVGVIVYNNQPGSINMDLSAYTYTAPVVSITQAEGSYFKENGTLSADGKYYTGTFDIEAKIGTAITNTGFSTVSSFSSWGVPGSLELKPEITAPGGNIYSVHGYAWDDQNSVYAGGGDSYENMSGTSMAAPQIAGMSALAAQYIRENGLEEQTGLKARTLAQSLLMSTAVPMFEDLGEYGIFYYPVLRQGAGLANIGNVVKAESYILMDNDANAGAADGKVKVELGDDPDKKGVYTFGFTLYNLTDTIKEYTLSADMFAQFVFADKGTLYMDTSTEYLEAEAEFDCGQIAIVPANGSVHVTAEITLTDADKKYLADFESGAYIEGYVYAVPHRFYDFNGDGKVNEDDGQRLLDYRTGLETVLYDEEHADIDGDGDIDTYDAYQFLELLAKGEIDPDSGEGLEGTVHSIPVFGFYGNWSTASMFDKGSYVNYNLAGTETRDPYLGNKNVNAFGVIHGSDPDSIYYLGGNVMIKDLTYHADRAAVNNTNGSSLALVQFAAIRNAADSMFKIVNETTGETIAESSMGSITAAYYYANGQTWRNTSLSFKPNYDFSGAEENEKVSVTFALAPEYYQDAAGNVRWEDIDLTNALSTTVTIDNTAPEIISAVLNGDTLTVTAKDNQYISAVALVNKGNTQTYAASGSNETQKAGDTVKFELDVADVNKDQLYLQVYDYALNVSTYAVEGKFGEGTIISDAIAFDVQDNIWVSYDKDEDALVELEGSNYNFTAATVVDHMVYAVDDQGVLYVMPEKDLSDTTRVANLYTPLGGPEDFFDMAYDPVSDRIAILTAGIAAIFVDPKTGVLDEELVWLPVDTTTLAIDDNGLWYSIEDGTNTLYVYDVWEDELLDAIDLTYVDEEDEVQELIAESAYQSLAFDSNTGKLYWAKFGIEDFFGILQFPKTTMVEIDLTGDEPEVTVYEDQLFYQATALIFPDKTTESKTPDWAKPSDKAEIEQVIINSKDTEKLFKGETLQLDADVLPWTATDKTVSWESDNEKVAAVDKNGKVTAIAEGTAHIFAISNADNDVYYGITVEVQLAQVTIEGALQDTEGKSQIIKWDLAKDDTWKKLADLGINGVESAALNAYSGNAYIMDSQSFDLHEIDLKDGSVVNEVSGIGVPYYDIAYSTGFSSPNAPIMFGVAESYLLLEDPSADLQGSGWNLATVLSNYTGADHLIGIANMGIGYDEEVGYYEQYALLDNSGALWTVGFYVDEDGIQLMLLNFWKGAVNEPFEALDQYNYGVSMVMGDDGDLYVSVMNVDDNRNNLYKLAIKRSTLTTNFIGCTEDEVWPLVLFSVTANAAAAASADEEDTLLGSAEGVTVESGFTSPAKGAAVSTEYANVEKSSINDVETEKLDVNDVKAAYAKSVPVVMAAEDVVEDENEIVGDTSAEIENNKVIVDIVAVNEEGEAVSTTNGLFKVTYDASKLTLAESNVNSEYQSVNDKNLGTVIIGYVNTDEAIEAGAEAAELVFTIKEGAELEKSDIIIEHVEVGETNFETEEGVEPPVEKPLPEPEVPDETTSDEPPVPESTPESSKPDVEIPDETTTSGDVTNDPDDNKPTGVVIAFVPAVIAAAGVIAAKKRKRK